MGPIFHRGRLDGSARVLVSGQDPAQHEAFSRRILSGEAGHRLQGFLLKLGIDRSYVLINTFLYSVLAHGGRQHQDDAGIVGYRARWLKAIFDTAPIEAVIALGTMADHAWRAWSDAPDGQAVPPAIPQADLPPGLPAWVAADDGWAKRGGRAAITLTVPSHGMPA